MLINKAKILITGGAGFIGSHLVSGLLAAGYAVRVLDNLSTGKEENLADVIDQIELIKGDVAELETVQAAMSGCAGVLHHAAYVSVPGSLADPQGSARSNLTGTLNCLIAARAARVMRFVFASSSAIYGNTSQLPISETALPQPESPYAVEKLAGEGYCHIFYAVHGLETVCLRYFNIYGPRQDPTSDYAAVVPKFFAAYERDEQPTVYGDGEQTRDFVFVSDVVSANLAALTNRNAPGKVMNVASGKQVSVNELGELIATQCDQPFNPTYAPARPGEVTHSYGHNQQAREILNFTPTTALREGLGKLT